MNARDEREPLRSWEEIRRRFPDEWVVLHDMDLDAHNAVRRARVASHARSSREAVDRVRNEPIGPEVAIRFTGERRERTDAMLLNLRW